MKKLFFGLLVLVSANCLAQTFPFTEGFTGVSSNTLPAGWTGDMKVMSYHGLNDDKALVSDMSSIDMSDTASTPWIGPMAASTEIIFWFRIVDEFIYPSTEKHYTGNDYFKIQVTTDEVNYTDVFTVDSSNQFATLNFQKKFLYLTTYGGQNVKLRFLTQYNAGSSYFVDIDSVKVRQGVNPNGISETNNNFFSVSPNPCKQNCIIRVSEDLPPGSTIVLYDLTGKKLFSETIASTVYPISLAKLEQGLYFIVIQTTEGVSAKKLIVSSP